MKCVCALIAYHIFCCAGNCQFGLFRSCRVGCKAPPCGSGSVFQDGLLLLPPEPKDYVTRLSGLQQEIWHAINSDAYLHEERDRG